MHISKTDFDSKKPGRYDIDGDNVFVVVHDYSTRNSAECEFEAHRKYIDVQYIAKGSELIGYAPFRGQDVTADYDEEKDAAFFKGYASFIKMDKGMFAIFFPEDLHMPGTGDGGPVRKVVVKVRV